MPVHTDAIHVEISKVKNKMTEIEGHLREQKKLGSKLRETTEKKIIESTMADVAIAGEIERFRWKKEQILMSAKFFEEESAAKIREYTTLENEINEEIAGFDILEFEGEKLHHRLKQVSTEQLQNMRLQQTERETKKQKDFDTRMAMEEILRKTIKNFDNDYQDEAIAKMEREAQQADSENDRIHAEFDLREEMTEKLIRQQQQSYEQLMKMKIERDVLQASTEIQVRNVSKLVAENERLEQELSDLNFQVRTLRTQMKELSIASVDKQALVSTVKSLKTELVTRKQKRKDTCKWTMDICTQLCEVGLRVADQERKYQNAKLSHQMDHITFGEKSSGDNSVEQTPRQHQDAPVNVSVFAAESTQSDEEHRVDLSANFHPDDVWRSNGSSSHIIVAKGKSKKAMLHSQSRTGAKDKRSTAAQPQGNSDDVWKINTSSFSMMN